MNKSIIIGIIFLMIIAFSGAASASYVTDKITKTHYMNGHYMSTEKSWVIHYSSKHIVFKYTYRDANGGWINYSRDYKKIAHNKIRERDYDNENGYKSKALNGKKVVKTKRSVYQQFKHERGGYKGVKSIYRHD